MKNHRIIKLGLILPDNSDIKDYQIKILNSLKKNKSFKIKLFKINNFQKNNTFIKNLFFLESKFYKKRTLNSNKIINFLKKYKKISYEELKSYYKKDIDLFINLSGKNISNKLIGIKKIFWEIVYGSENFQMFPVCFNDVVDEKPYSKIKIIELINRDFKLIDEGFFNIKNYAILHQEFIFEKTTVLLFKSLNLFKSYNLNYKKINKLKVINKNISFFKILKYYYKNYFLNLVNKNKYINWQILTAHKKKIFDLKYSKKNVLHKKSYKNYFADPFIYKFKKNIFIFFENFNKKKNKGHISYINLKEKNKIYDVINEKFHLSYPFVFDYKNKIYLVPESSKKNQLQIWRSVKFPKKWKLYKKRLIGENFADPTFFLDKNKNLWLFINKSIDKFKDHNSELYIYKVENNFDKFIPHKLNPVIVDCRLARNAGNLFYYKNKLLKPCQMNIYGKYGYGLQFIEITKLNIDIFNYKKINNLKNIHHFSVYDKFISWDYKIN